MVKKTLVDNCAFTCGASSAQRSESRHSLVKAFSETTTLVALFKSLEKLTAMKSRKEERSRSLLVRLSPLKMLSSVTGPVPLIAAQDLSLSQSCYGELRKELRGTPYANGASH